MKWISAASDVFYVLFMPHFVNIKNEFAKKPLTLCYGRLFIKFYIFLVLENILSSGLVRNI